ncbi:MAG: hypothetical protein HXX10_28560 [Rhodoplanes sp.]|nr:hypothetical protein [Rhodoplanes sp.]
MRAAWRLIAVAAGLVLPGSAAPAMDLDGAWATDRAVCSNVFVKKGGSIAFRPKSELHGSGFIIEGNSIRGASARCTIKTRKEDGSTVHLLASCATDIMLSSMQFSVKVVGPDKISRVFPGMDGMELAYDRCSF